MIEPVVDKIRAELGNHLYGFNATTLEMATIQMLIDRGETVAVAESMTGGALGARLTSVAGSSAAFVGGAIAYTISTKESLLGLSEALISEHGPVSEEVAKAMAEAIRDRLGATYGIAITGNAGPTPDIDDKPIGLVFIGLAGPGGTSIERGQYRGLREDIQRRATQTALTLLRWKLL